MSAVTQWVGEVVEKTQVNLDVLRERIRERMGVLDLSGNAVSRQAGLGVSYVNDLLKGASNRPSLENLSQIARALKCDLAYILGTQDAPAASDADRPSSGTDALVLLPTGRRGGTEAVRVPLYSSPWPEPDGFFVMPVTPDEFSALAFEPVNGSYAVLVPDESMAPRYFTGEKVFVNPRRPIQVGCFVVVTLNDRRSIIRRVHKLDGTSVTLTDLADNKELHLERGDINTIHRIMASCEA